MLGVTTFLWSTAVRLLEDRRAAFFAAALFAVLAPTLHLGSFATYDALALLLLAAATWCVAGAPGRRHALWWLAGAGLVLALANAAKYATALFDPTVACVAFLTARPDAGRPEAGWKDAVSRTAVLVGTTAATLAVLLVLGGRGYLTGIDVTTTGRVSGTDPASLVLTDAWWWSALVLVPALAAVVVCVARRERSRALLLTVLALTALLAPVDQARIQTLTSLDKHVDFGTWFAALAAGYLLSILPRTRAVLAASLGALVPATVVGTIQARAMIDWPDTTRLVQVVRPLTAHGGHFLVESGDILQYYLPQTTWQQWSTTAQNGNLEYYHRAITQHYYSVVVLDFDQTTAVDAAIGLALSQDDGYQLAAKVSSGQTVFYVWKYVGRV
jgi:uncharacterized membrane protein (DUF441 family)